MWFEVQNRELPVFSFFLWYLFPASTNLPHFSEMVISSHCMIKKRSLCDGLGFVCFWHNLRHDCLHYWNHLVPSSYIQILPKIWLFALAISLAVSAYVGVFWPSIIFLVSWLVGLTEVGPTIFAYRSTLHKRYFSTSLWFLLSSCNNLC